MTPVPIVTVAPAAASAPPPSHAAPAAPHAPGSPQGGPGVPHQQKPHQDSLDDIRADLNHYPEGLTEPDPTDQQALADAVPHNPDGTPQRFPDPFGHWAQLQNDGGNTVPGRSNNCADCSRSFLETWYGNPQVSAPRTLDLNEHGQYNPWSPERDANDNQIRWTGAAHTYAGPGGDNPDTVHNIESALLEAGPGSAAIVQVDWPGGSGHAFNAVNHDGKIVWIDTQSGEVSHEPLHIANAEHVWHIPLDANRNPIPVDHADFANFEGQTHEAQPENNQTSQNDVSGDIPKQGDNDLAEPSTVDPNTANGESENEIAGPQSKGVNPPDPHSMPDGQEPSQKTPESDRLLPGDSDVDRQHSSSPETSSGKRRPTPAKTASMPDPQSRPDEATGPDGQGHIPNKKTEQPNGAAKIPPLQPGSPSEHGQLSARAASPRTADARTTNPRSETPSWDRRAPANPAGTQPYEGSSDPWTEGGDETDDGKQAPATPESSSPHEESQPKNHQHYGMLGDQAQRDLRERNIHQIDQEPVYRYLENLANNRNHQLRELLEGSKNGTTWRRDDLKALPGFDDLTRGQQLATVAVLARLSIDFHTNQGVGVSPHLRDGDNSAYKWREDAEREAHRKRDILRQKNYEGVDKHQSSRAAGKRSESDLSKVDGSVSNSSTPTQRARHHLDEAYGKTVAEQVVTATSDMKPDFSGRNYAVVEVIDPGPPTETHYVADASFNYAGPRPAHSEPHIGGWIERLNEDRAAEGKQPLDVVHMYTEREPCGHPSESPGHADCSGYILHYMPTHMPVSYGTGYRKGEPVTPFSDPQQRKGVNTARQAMEADAQHHLNRVSDILKAYAFPTPTSNP